MKFKKLSPRDIFKTIYYSNNVQATYQNMIFDKTISLQEFTYDYKKNL